MIVLLVLITVLACLIADLIACRRAAGDNDRATARSTRLLEEPHRPPPAAASWVR